MKLLADSTQVLLRDWFAIFGFCLVALWGGLIVSAFITRITKIHLTSSELFSLGAAGWVVATLFAATIIFLSRVAWPVGILCAILLITGLVALYFLRERLKTKNILWLLLLIFAVLFFLRLAFLAKTSLPLYFDSAEHYRIIEVLMREYESPQTGTLSWPAPTYYHIGFHVVTAILTSTLQADPKTMILLFGQFVLACIPVSVYLIASRESKSSLGGLFAVLLAGFGWFMPAHAVNWGKYPALISLLTIQFSLGIAYLLNEQRAAYQKRMLWIFLILSILVSFLVHTRSVIVIGIFIATWILANLWTRSSKVARYIIFGIVLIVLIGFTYWLESGDLKSVFEPYFGAGILVTCIALLLSLFAARVSPRIALCSMLSILLILSCLFIPIKLPVLGNLTLLDRPFVEMILFIPLAIIGGVGFAGLLLFLQKFPALPRVARIAIMVFISVALIANSWMKYSYYPSSCCQLVQPDDIIALDWLNKNLPANAKIAISSSELNVQFNETSEAYTGIDAGVWIAPLTDRVTMLLPFTFDFSQASNHAQLCQMKLDYIYVGGKAQSFDRTKLNSQPDWYHPIFTLPQVQIDEIRGCT
ncbi:MAG TPA: hypothetical protein VMT73_14345 [Anaerolineales bacterium]|nr:hypothetical protein [Anaerolineales bacterium]